MQERNKTLFVIRNPQRAAFTMELLTGEIKAELFGPDI
jgi:hypothetical protein